MQAVLNRMFNLLEKAVNHTCILIPESEMIDMAFLANNAKKALNEALEGRPLGTEHRRWAEEAASFWGSVLSIEVFYMSRTHPEATSMFKAHDFFVAHAQDVMKQTLGHEDLAGAATAAIPILIALARDGFATPSAEGITALRNFFAGLHDTTLTDLHSRRR